MVKFRCVVHFNDICYDITETIALYQPQLSSRGSKFIFLLNQVMKGGNVVPWHVMPVLGQVKQPDLKRDLGQYGVRGRASDFDQFTLYPEMDENY